MKFLQNLHTGIAVGLFVALLTVTHILAVDIPQWTSTIGTVEVGLGETKSAIVSASGGSDTKIECSNCSLATLIDNGDGTAVLTWDTGASPPPELKTYFINIKASSKIDPSKFITGTVNFKVIAAGSGSTQKTTYCVCSYLEGAPTCSTGAAYTDYLEVGKQSNLSGVNSKTKSVSPTEASCPTLLDSHVSGNEKICTATCKIKVCDSPAAGCAEPAGTVPAASAPTDPSGGGSAGLPPSGAPADVTQNRQAVFNYVKSKYGGRPDGYVGPLPDCAFSGTCRDVNDLVVLMVNIGRYLFGIIGSLALAMFIYGGFTWLTSMGNPEKVKKGGSIVFGAAIGLLISFSAYLLIDFVLDALQVTSDFRKIN